MRLAVHCLGGGQPDDLPENWKAHDYLGPPGPAAEYAHCADAIGKTNAGDPGTPQEAWRQFHREVSSNHNVGLELYDKKKRGGSKVKHIRLSEWAVQAMAGTPCVALMLTLDKAQIALSEVVCIHPAH